MMGSVPNKPKTTLRNVRIDDELWSAAQQTAAANGTNVSEVIRTHLQKYVDEHMSVGGRR